MSDENIENNQTENHSNGEEKKNWLKKLLGLNPAYGFSLCLTTKVAIVIVIFTIIFYLFNYFYEQSKISDFKKKYENLNYNEFFNIGKMHNKATSLSLVLLYDNRVVISGGNYLSDISEFEIFNPNTGEFKILKLPAKYKNQRNSILLDKNNILINDSFVFDNKTGKYINIFNKKDYTNYSTSFMYSENEVFILEEDEKSYLYDYKNKSLKEINLKFPFRLADKKFIKMDNDNVLIYGICSINDKLGAYFQTHLYLWNINQNRFKRLDSNGISTDVSIVKLNNDEVIIFGQKFYNQDDSYIGEKKQVTYKLNVKTNKLSELNNSIINRTSAPIALKISDNKIFLIGGENDKEKSKMTAEVYNVTEDKYFKFSSTISAYIPANPFKRPSLLELSNNDILICGGVWESKVLDTCVIYKKGK